MPDHVSETSSARAAVIAAVADALPSPVRPLLVAVDGPDGAGKTCFADELADELTGRGVSVVRASVDDFHHPREYRHRLGRTPQSVWSRHFDYRALRRELLQPWLRGPGSSFRRRWHDVATDEHVDDVAESVPDRGVLVVDGVFLQRPELTHVWDVAIYLDVPPEITVPRMAARDGTDPDPAHPDQERYVLAQRLYQEAFDPKGQADLVIDNSELAAPVLIADEPSATPDGWEDDGDYWLRSVRIPRGSAAASLIAQLERDAREPS